MTGSRRSPVVINLCDDEDEVASQGAAQQPKPDAPRTSSATRSYAGPRASKFHASVSANQRIPNGAAMQSNGQLKVNGRLSQVPSQNPQHIGSSALQDRDHVADERADERRSEKVRTEQRASMSTSMSRQPTRRGPSHELPLRDSLPRSRDFKKSQRVEELLRSNDSTPKDSRRASSFLQSSPRREGQKRSRKESGPLCSKPLEKRRKTEPSTALGADQDTSTEFLSSRKASTQTRQLLNVSAGATILRTPSRNAIRNASNNAPDSTTRSKTGSKTGSKTAPTVIEILSDDDEESKFSNDDNGSTTSKAKSRESHSLSAKESAEPSREGKSPAVGGLKANSRKELHTTTQPKPESTRTHLGTDASRRLEQRLSATLTALSRHDQDAMNELRRSDMLATMWAQSGDSGSAYMSASNAENDGLATSTEQAGQETFKALATEKNPTTNMETKDCDSEDRHALIKNAGDDHVTGPPESGAGLQIPGSGSAHAPASVRSPLHAHNDAHRAAYPLQHDMSNDRDTPDAQKVAAVKKSPAMDVVDCRANEHAAETTMEAQHPTTAPEMPATSDVRTHSRDRNEAEDRLAGFGIWREEDGDKVVALRTDDEGENQPFAAMSSAKQVEAVVGKHLEEQRSDNERQNRELLKQARLSVNNQPRHTKTSAKTKSTFSFANLKPLPLPPTCEDSRQSGAGSSAKAKNSFSFANLKPLKLLPDDKASRQSGAVKMISETFHPGGKSTKKTLVVQPTIITPKDDMPEYSYAVSIRNNFLAPNSTTLQHWPYFGDNFDYDEVEGLGEQYSLDVKDRPLKLLRLSQAEKYHPYADAALRELGLEWEDVIAFLLEAHPDVGNDPDALRALERRSESTAEEFCREHKRTAKVLSVLQPSTPDKLGKAAMLCDFFHKMAGLSLWHVARKYLFRSTPKDPVSDGNTLLDEMTCRVCLRFACPYHGEIEEWQESDDSDEEEGSNTEKKKRAITTDIVNPPNVNHRTRVAFSSYTDLPSAQDSDISIRKERRTLHYWEKNYKHSAEDRGPFYPCHHPGQSCRHAECSCFEAQVPCEKTCTCAPDCARKFQGCACHAEKTKRGQKSMCYEDDRCVCFGLGRECDPDLCATCGVVEVLDPPNRYRDDLFNGRCRNAGIQLGVPKFTLLGNSGVHGFGLYVGEDVKQHEFVGEYKGEVITKNEAERRGAVYKHQKLSYLFSLNATQEIDSTYFGNKTRYINHAGPGKFNLYPRILLVNTVHRIALFAKRNITKGEELLFDYGPQFPDEELGGKSAYQPHVRNSDVVQQFWEVEHAEDATGLRRARKAAKSAVKGRSRKVEDGADGKVDKRRGGARGAGAGRKKTRVEATKLEDDDQRAQADDHISAGDRLAAFNVIDETGDDGVIMDVVQGAEEDEDDFEPEESGGEVSDESDESGAMLKRPAARGRQARRGNTGRKIK